MIILRITAVMGNYYWEINVAGYELVLKGIKLHFHKYGIHLSYKSNVQV